MIEMRATMKMHVETVFGNTCEMGLEADLDNPHELTNRRIFTDMARLLRYMAEEVRSENEQTILADARVPAPGDAP